MKFSWRGYFLTALYFVGAACFYVVVRFAGHSSIAAFANIDLRSVPINLYFAQAVVAGLVIGTIFYFFTQIMDIPAIRRRRYAALLAIQATSNFVCVCLVLIGLTASTLVLNNKAFTASAFASALISINFLVLLTYYTVVSFLFILIKQIDQKFGPGNLRKIIAGTFYHPREVEMIVMFLDLKDSTNHAERLGHLEFGSLIQDCFIDMSIVTDFKAQFYQYVGDESILLWEVNDGLKNANCLRAYFAFIHQLEKKKDYYQSRYGLVPQFKAGANIGFATVLEVGEIKREISYLGDVLNTAARIQDQCNVYQERLMISEMLNERLSPIPKDLLIVPIGLTELKGRSEPMHLYGIREQSKLLRD